MYIVSIHTLHTQKLTMTLLSFTHEYVFFFLQMMTRSLKEKIWTGRRCVLVHPNNLSCCFSSITRPFFTKWREADTRGRGCKGEQQSVMV